MILTMNRTYRKAPMTQRLVRTFVPTGEGRCQLAAVWSLVPDTQAPAEEPSLRRPAWRTLLCRWRALYFAATRLAYVAG